MFRGKTLAFLFPCNTWAQVPVQSDFAQIRVHSPFSLQQEDNYQTVWWYQRAPSEGTLTERCWWMAETLCCGDELVWHQFVGIAAPALGRSLLPHRSPFCGSQCLSFHLLVLVVCLGFYSSSLLPLAQDSLGRIVEHCYFRVWKSPRPLIWEYKLHLSPGYLWRFLSNHKSLFFSAVCI